MLAMYWLWAVPRWGGACTRQHRGNLLTCRVTVTPNPTKIAGNVLVPSTRDMFVCSLVLMWFLLLPSLVRVGFIAFACRRLGDWQVGIAGEPTYLRVDMEETCWK